MAISYGTSKSKTQMLLSATYSFVIVSKVWEPVKLKEPAYIKLLPVKWILWVEFLVETVSLCKPYWS